MGQQQDYIGGNRIALDGIGFEFYLFELNCTWWKYLNWFDWTCTILQENRHSTSTNKIRSATHWDTKQSNKTCLRNMESKPLGTVSYLNTDLIHNLVKLFPIRSALTLPMDSIGVFVICTPVWHHGFTFCVPYISHLWHNKSHFSSNRHK